MSLNTYSIRVDNIVDGSGGSASNGGTHLSVGGANPIVNSDGDGDTVSGSRSEDLFFVALSDDGISDLDDLETVFDSNSI